VVYPIHASLLRQVHQLIPIRFLCGKIEEREIRCGRE
jgi:hypothetical protein